MREEIWAFLGHPVVILAIIGGIVSVIYWVAGTTKDVSTLKQFMAEIREDIRKIFERLPERGVVAGSPLRLTEKGRKMADLVDAEKWAEDVVVMLLSKARGQAHWEIDQMCHNYIRLGELASDDDRDWVEQSVGKIAFSFGTDREDAQNVLQVVLRDAVIAKLEDSGTVEEPPL